MPCSTYQSKRAWHQYSYHWSASAGGTKNSISICSNSRVRKTKLPGVISLRNDLPTCAMPNGGFLRDVSSTFLKVRNMPSAVAGLRKTAWRLLSTGPGCVLDMRLKWRASVKELFEPQFGHVSGSSSLSRRNRSLHSRQSTSGSVKLARWPDASHTGGGDRIEASRPTTSWRSCTIERHHASLTLRSSSTPTGP